jgi:hypothetical protein
MRQQCREQRVFLRPRGIDIVGMARHGHTTEQIRPQFFARNAGCGFHVDQTLGGHTGPIGNGGLRNTELAGERADPARDADRLLQADIPHGTPFRKKDCLELL